MKTLNQFFSQLSLVFLFFFFSQFNSTLSAQFSIGLNGALHASKVDYASRIDDPSEEVPKSNYGLGYGYGLELNYRLNTSFLLRSSFAYAQRGDDQISINAFEIPLILVFQPQKDQGISYQLFAGGYYGYWRLLEGKNQGDFHARSFALIDEDNTEWGIKMGAGLSLPIMHNQGSIDLRTSWTKGLINGLNQGFSFTIAYVFHLY